MNSRFLRCLAWACWATAFVTHAIADNRARPNILWISCEDMSPRIGPYGDRYATTPNLDRLAAQGFRYQNVWSNAPVCAPARTALISGLYPTATGSEHMRSMTRLPAHMKMFPQILRERGYYCTNNSKEDYNLEKTGKVWDESSPKAHWKNRAAGQPFFAVFNITVTHESGVHKRAERLVHDPAQVPLPAHHPDHPAIRADWAQVYDNITAMDAAVGGRLKELDEAGLADETIVVFFSDHGAGMPWYKRWPYDRGLRVPLIVRIPAEFRALAPKDYGSGRSTDRMVSFVDFAPTVLSLARIVPPTYLHGAAFMGAHEAPPHEYLHGFRGRMDERYDMVRSVRDHRYVYVRNYMPHKIYGQYLQYMFLTETTRVWKELFEGGTLPPHQAAFWRPKPPEELYDLESDPQEIRNLAASPTHRSTLERFRKVQRKHALAIRDVGFLPEDEMHRRAAGITPFEMGHDPMLLPLDHILATAELAASRDVHGAIESAKAMNDSDSAVRYWAATGLLVRGESAVRDNRDQLHQALADDSPSVRVAAAEALAKHGSEPDANAAIDVLLELSSMRQHGVYVSIAALNVLDDLDTKASRGLVRIRRAADGGAAAPERVRLMPQRLVEHILLETVAR